MTPKPIVAGAFRFTSVEVRREAVRRPLYLLDGDPTMTITKALVTAAALAMIAPVAPALAHESDDSYNRHARDHSEHRSFHQEVGEAHERAHEEGFESRAEHRAYHRALRDQHEEFHEDHPNTRQDHYPRYRYWRSWDWRPTS